jgi:hypothetical protein
MSPLVFRGGSRFRQTVMLWRWQVSSGGIELFIWSSNKSRVNFEMGEWVGQANLIQIFILCSSRA